MYKNHGAALKTLTTGALLVLGLIACKNDTNAAEKSAAPNANESAVVPARQMVFRPRVTLRPHDTGIPGVFLCSAATPPGGGVHGLCGAAAAARALAFLG